MSAGRVPPTARVPPPPAPLPPGEGRGDKPEGHESAAAAATLGAAQEQLKAAGVEDPRRDARLLLAHALGIDAGALAGDPRRKVPADAAKRFGAAIARRARREPVSRILGRRAFWTLDLALTPDTLDPRPDSETLVETVLAEIDARGWRRDRPLRLLDLGTGSGCLLLALLSELPRAWGAGVDRSPGAAAAARANAVAAGLADRAHFVVSDWNQALGGPFDLAVANPPYIRRDSIAGLMPEVALWDPVLALDGGVDGLDAYRAMLADLRRVLAPGAVVALELGAGQGSNVSRLLRDVGLRPARVARDLAGIERCIVATGG